MSVLGDGSDRWSVRFNQHQINGMIQSFENVIRAVRERFPDTDDESFDFLDNLVNFVRRHMAASDGRLVTTSMLGEVESAFDHLIRYLNDSANLDATFTSWQFPLEQADELIDAFSRWPLLDPESVVGAQDARIAANEKRSKDALKDVEDQVAKIIEDFKANVTAREESFNSSMLTLQESTKELSSRISSQVELIGQQLPTLQAQIVSQREEFVQAEEKRRKEYVTQIEALDTRRTEIFKEMDDAFSAQLLEESEKFTKLTDDTELKAEAQLDRLDTLHSEAQRIVQAISQTGMSGGYQRYAKEERSSADRWRKLSIVFACLATLVLAIDVIWGHANSNVAWSTELTRLLLAASLAGLSSYSARQAWGHRKRAEHSSSLELQLASIGPYLEGLEVTTRDEVLKNLAYRFFTEDTINDDDSPDAGPNNWLRIAQVLMPPKH